MLDEVRRILRPGGVFVLAEDTPHTAAEYANAVCADERINFEPAGAPHNYRNADNWRSELLTRGFAVMNEFRFTWLYPPVTLWPVPHSVYVCRPQL
jgi:hypothetical protein